MRARTVLAALFSLLLVGATHAQSVTGARLLEAGVYSAQLKTEEKTGKTVSTGYKLVKAGQAIDSGGFEVSQFDDGLPRVGFWWYLEGRDGTACALRTGKRRLERPPSKYGMAPRS